MQAGCGLLGTPVPVVQRSPPGDSWAGAVVEGWRGGAGVGPTCGPTGRLDGLINNGEAAAGAICFISRPPELVTVERDDDAGTCEQAASTRAEPKRKSLSLVTIFY
jgi:hypothetical protein